MRGSLKMSEPLCWLQGRKDSPCPPRPRTPRTRSRPLRVMSTCKGSGVRIAKNESSRLEEFEAPPELRLDVVTETPADDEVVKAPGGVFVFIEPRPLSLVEDRVLDRSPDEAG